ncbi:nuclear transport factor 2 family protein [Falsiroseomonas sp. HW251]|uniref:nuclear transport factor 2 family protein n=1 Tax=Falsiroseomonas sp. HW251 TaxID=3390998 RepID=UPI003D319631
MSVTPEQMDRLVHEHFTYEATDDVDGVVASMAEDAEHEIIPSPHGTLRDRDSIRGMYAALFRDLKGEDVTPIRRLYGDGFLVDEAIWHGQIVDGRPFLCEGRSGRASFRLLHIFEFAGGKIARESVWCDLAAIQRQLGCAPR